MRRGRSAKLQAFDFFEVGLFSVRWYIGVTSVCSLNVSHLGGIQMPLTTQSVEWSWGSRYGYYIITWLNTVRNTVQKLTNQERLEARCFLSYVTNGIKLNTEFTFRVSNCNYRLLSGRNTQLKTYCVVYELCERPLTDNWLLFIKRNLIVLNWLL